MKLTDLTVRELLAAFASSDPTPGGGSAAALSGAVGASLLAMVASLPKSRAATEEDRERLAYAGERCRTLADALTALVDRDSEAYDLVTAAYRRPKGTDEEKSSRSAAIQDALRAATDAPLEAMRACAAAIEQAPVIAQLGNAAASSDVGVGRALLGAGLHGARLNVDINLESVKDGVYVGNVRREVSDLERAGAVG
jgi:methenyltetrahydrofolate cyclohydrolase